MYDTKEMRLRNLEATIADLRRERAADRALIREILSQVLTLTDKQTQLLGQWTAVMTARQQLLTPSRSPITYTLTEEEEYRRYVEKHHPELLDQHTVEDYGVLDEKDREVSS